MSCRRAILFIPAIAAVCVVASGCSPAMKKSLSIADAYGAMQRGDDAGAAAMLERLARERVDDMNGAMARDMLAELHGTRAFPDNETPCSARANAVHEKAEEDFEAGRLADARAGYADALKQCPGNARLWIHAGDVEFRLKNMEAARELYLRGLAIDPWDRAGHRYLSDVEVALGHHDEAWNQSLLAVISDPSYEAAWEYLKQATLRLGGQFRRQYETKPYVTIEGYEATIVFPSDNHLTCANAWTKYGAALGVGEGRRILIAATREKDAPPTRISLDGKPVVANGNDARWAAASPLGREQILVGLVLEDFDAGVRPDCHRASKTWPVIHEAVSSGYRDEAIFLLLFDRPLAPEYERYRAEHADRLIDFIRRFVAILPGASGRGRLGLSA